jgi:hypothetical protein
MNYELRVEGVRERGARAHTGCPLRARVQHQAFQPAATEIETPDAVTGPDLGTRRAPAHRARAYPRPLLEMR